MTSTKNNRNYGPPPPITKLTVEQDLKMRLLEDKLNSDEARKEDIVTLFLALQRQNFVLANSLMNLIDKWPKQAEILPMFGVLLPK